MTKLAFSAIISVRNVKRLKTRVILLVDCYLNFSLCKTNSQYFSKIIAELESRDEYSFLCGNAKLAILKKSKHPNKAPCSHGWASTLLSFEALVMIFKKVLYGLIKAAPVPNNVGLGTLLLPKLTFKRFLHFYNYFFCSVCQFWACYCLWLQKSIKAENLLGDDSSSSSHWVTWPCLFVQSQKRGLIQVCSLRLLIWDSYFFPKQLFWWAQNTISTKHGFELNSGLTLKLLVFLYQSGSFYRPHCIGL